MEIKSRKKLMIIVPNLKYGGAQRVIVTLNRYLKDYYDIVLVLLTDEIDFEYNGRIIKMPFGMRENILKKAFIFLRRTLYLRMIYKKEIPDIILSFTESANFLTLLACRGSSAVILGVRNFLSVMEQKSKIIQYLFRKSVRLFYRFADKVFANSDESARDLMENFKLIPEKVTFIHNPVDIKNIEKKKKHEDIRPQDRFLFEKNIPIIITIGRMVKQKGHGDLIKAFALVRQQVDSRLIIIGDGTLKQELVLLSDKHSLRNSITFTGFIDNVYPYLSKSTVFVLPSYYEGFPNVLLEAMAVGLPVISYDCRSGPREIFCDGKYGELSPVGDYKVLADKILSLLRDKDKREKLASAALERVMDFDVSFIFGKYKEMIDNSCKEKQIICNRLDFKPHL